MNTKGSVIGVNGNLVTIEVQEKVSMNEVAYISTSEGKKLKAEVIRVKGTTVEAQVFEFTKGIQVNDTVEFTDLLLSVELGPGLLGRVYDGLQNPLNELAEQCGFFLERGVYLSPLSRIKKWEFTPNPALQERKIVRAGDQLGSVGEGVFTHKIFVPFDVLGEWTLNSLVQKGLYTLDDTIASISSSEGKQRKLGMSFHWPVKVPIKLYKERLVPKDPMVTKVRIIDTFFPVALGGTYCVPGPFGAGKTVLQQITSRNAEVDIVIVAACGERAGEVVETLREFPELIDPKTGKTLMERTIIICNTSSMPVAAREASVYTAVTFAEYYRQMGLNTLLLADSTSRWAQAMREMSGRLEEIPGEEAFPAYLESVIAAFYERAGRVRLNDDSFGSVTIGGAVSPAGGNFEEPVTQATLKVVGAFHGLSRERSDARKYPSIHPLESWSKYTGPISADIVSLAYNRLSHGNEVGQMMKVVGEEGTSIDDFIIYLKGEFLDRVYLQQDAFDKVDCSVSLERQQYSFDMVFKVLFGTLRFENKDEARSWFAVLTQKFLDYNGAEWNSSQFTDLVNEIKRKIEERFEGYEQQVQSIISKQDMSGNTANNTSKEGVSNA